MDSELKIKGLILKELNRLFLLFIYYCPINTIQGIFQCWHFALMILTWLYQTYCLCTFRLPALLYRFVRDALFKASHVTRIRYPTQQISLNFRFSFFLFVLFSSSAKYVRILFVLFYALNWVFIYLSFFSSSVCFFNSNTIRLCRSIECLSMFYSISIRYWTWIKDVNSRFLCICSEQIYRQIG